MPGPAEGYKGGWFCKSRVALAKPVRPVLEVGRVGLSQEFPTPFHVKDRPVDTSPYGVHTSLYATRVCGPQRRDIIPRRGPRTTGRILSRG